MPNGLFKLLQRQIYTCLSSRNGLLFCTGGFVLVLVSALQFGEVALEWSMNQYATAFNSYHDNIAGRSFADRLCAPLPIDIVYTWVNGTDPVLLENLSKAKLELEAEINRTREREERKKQEDAIVKNQTLRNQNQSKENMTATLNNTKGSVLLSKLPSVDLMASKSSQTGKKEFNHDRPSPRQKKKKKIKAGTRSLKMVDTTNKDVEKKPVKAKGVVTDYSQIKLQDNKDGKDKNDQKNKIEDVDKGEKDGKLVSDDKLQQEKKQKYQEVLQKLQTHGSTNKTGSNDKDARRSEQQLAQKRNLTSTKKPDDICQGKLCLPAYTLLIEEGLPSNITLNQVRGVHQNFASATEVFRVTSVGSHIETATCVQFPYQRAVLDAANVTVLWLNKSLTTTLGFLTTDKTLLHSVVLKQTVIMTGFAANATQLQLTSVLAGHFKPHLVSVTLHNSSAAVVKFDNATYVESILKRPQGNITIDQHLVVIEPALLVWNPLSPTIAPSKDDKDKLEAVSDIYSANRFQDNEELRYSLRSVEKFAPWVRHIYLVTNGQIPYWLDLDNPRLTIITHQEIFQNKSHLPTFSSPAIESHIHRIPGLSKKFIYMNDDVMFGQDIGPDDFYTHTRGQKAYLAWQVPHCAEGCPPTWITDKYCDKACNNSACDWDGGDCVGVSGRASSIYSGWRGAHGGLFASSSHFCNTGCADSWMGDRYCDSACNVLECGFDTGDCGVGSFNKMHGIEVTENVSLIHLPLGLKAVYFNLTASMDGRKITEGDVTKADVVRVAVIAQLYKTLTIVFHPKQNLTLLSIRIVSSEINKTKIDIRFNITVDTFTPLPAKPDVAPTSTVLANRTGNDTTMLTSKNGTEIISLWEEDIPMPKQPELFNSLDYVVPLFRNGTVLPTDVLSQLETLKHEYKIGDLTEKGYYRRKAKILREVVERNESFGQMVFGSEIPKFMVAVGNASSSEQLTGNRKNDSEDISKQQEEKVIQHSDDIDRPSSKKKDHGQTVPRESTLRKILWINEQESTSVEVKGDYGDWERTDDELYVAAWIANTKKKQLHLQEELEWTKSQWLENHSPQSTSPAGFRTRGVLPWEKQQDFDSLIAKIVSQDKYLKTEDGLHRKLLDAYADSLKYVNKLYNRKYGHVARKVPAHCPHMIDIDHMAELQAMFPDEYESTSSHNLRHPEDMQFAFSYYYYLIDEKIKFNLTEMFNAMDTDMSGILSYRELRTLMARILDLPITLKAMERFEQTLYNCSKSTNYTVPSVSDLDMEYNYEDSVPLVTLELLSRCEPIVELMNKSVKAKKKFKTEIMGEDDVAFKMIEENITKTVQQLDWIRLHTRKFICLNDNIDHRKPDSIMVKALVRDFLEAMFPKPSQFELPPEYRNRFLHMDELNEWRQQREVIRFWTHIAFACLLLMTLATFFSTELKQLIRKCHNFLARLGGQRGRRRFVTV